LRLNEDGEISNRYLWGPAVDQVLADEQVSSDGQGDYDTDQILWPLGDHQGTVRDLAKVNGSGDTEIVNTYSYDAYGVLLTETAPAVDHLFGFTARPTQTDAGLVNCLNRWYDPIIASWITQDPITFQGGDANLYRYCGNDPVNSVDPSGLAWWNPFTWFDWGIDWSDAVDQEIEVVRQLNEAFGTSHTRLDAFSPEERARIEAALGNKIDWEGGAIRAAEGELKTRQKVLVGSEVCLWGAAAADVAAAGFAVAPVVLGTGASSAPVAVTIEQGGAIAELTIANGAATATVTSVSGLTHGFVNSTIAAARAAGATSATISTGLTLNPALAAKLRDLAASGGTIFGGRVVEVVGGPCPIFNIIFDKL